MEKDKLVIKQALAFINEDSKNLKNVFANKKNLKHEKIAASPMFYVCEILAEQPTQDDPSVNEKIKFSTTATDIQPVHWKFIFEHSGWYNVKIRIVKQSAKQDELFSLVKNDAITESTIPKARFAKAASYFTSVKFVDKLSSKTEEVTFIVKPSYMLEESYKQFLINMFRSLPDIQLTDLEIAKAKAPGTLDFKDVPEVFLRGKQANEIVREFAWVISCRDSTGNLHEFRTVSSNTPVELYERKLKQLGFTNIDSSVTSKPGTIKLDDLVLNIRSFKQDSLSDKIEQGADKILDIKDKFERSNVGKGFKILKDVIDWARK